MYIYSISRCVYIYTDIDMYVFICIYISYIYTSLLYVCIYHICIYTIILKLFLCLLPLWICTYKKCVCTRVSWKGWIIVAFAFICVILFPASFDKKLYFLATNIWASKSD